MQGQDNRNGSIRLFISKSAEELYLLPEFCEQNNSFLSTHSFLSFEPVDFHIKKTFDVVFFASPRAVRFFLDQSDIQEKIQIAVAGESTRRHLEKRGFEVHFFPKNSGNVEESSTEFAQWLNNKKVLFPTSDISQKSYTRWLHPHQFETVQVYKTQISTQKIEKNDVYVFTSPSNVEGFLKSNTIPFGSTVIAWGETTLNVLKSNVDSHALFSLEQSSEEHLIVLLKQLFTHTK